MTAAADHDRAKAFCLSWLSADYDPDQHPEWRNLARAYLQTLRALEASQREVAKLRRIMATPTGDA